MGRKVLRIWGLRVQGLVCLRLEFRLWRMGVLNIYTDCKVLQNGITTLNPKPPERLLVNITTCDEDPHPLKAPGPAPMSPPSRPQGSRRRPHLSFGSAARLAEWGASCFQGLQGFASSPSLTLHWSTTGPCSVDHQSRHATP